MKLPTSSFHRLRVTRHLIGPVTSWLPADITRPPRRAISLSAAISPLGLAWPWDHWDQCDHWDGFGMASKVQPLAPQSTCLNKPYFSSFLRAATNDAHPEAMTTEKSLFLYYYSLLYYSNDRYHQARHYRQRKGTCESCYPTILRPSTILLTLGTLAFFLIPLNSSRL